MRDPVPARDVLATVREPFEPAICDGDPPQLVGAIDRGREGEPAAALRGDQPRALAPRQVAAHPGAGHQVVRRGDVPATGRRGVRSVRCEQPDVVPASRTALHPMPERRDRGAVGKPGRGGEHRAGTAGHGRDRLRVDVDDVDVQPFRNEIRVPPAVRGEGDASSVGRPCRGAICGAAVGQARRLARGSVDQPEVADLVVREPRAVEHVFKAVDEPVVGRWRRAGARLGLAVDAAAAVIVGAGRAMGGGHDDQSAAVG